MTRRRLYKKRVRSVIDIRRLKFGELTAVRLAGRSKRRSVMWFCNCSCGQNVVVESDRLRRGERETCGKNGHYPKFVANPLRAKFPVEYRAWASIKDRCYNRYSVRWKTHGKIGVVLTPEWLASFEKFLLAVGKRPSPRHVLRRLDTTGNYEPGNVEWRIEGGT